MKCVDGHDRLPPADLIMLSSALERQQEDFIIQSDMNHNKTLINGWFFNSWLLQTMFHQCVIRFIISVAKKQQLKRHKTKLYNLCFKTRLLKKPMHVASILSKQFAEGLFIPVYEKKLNSVALLSFLFDAY